MANWNQPQCERCWIGRHTGPDGIRAPVRTTNTQVETCAYCGLITIMGVYVRDNPAAVPYPAPDDDDEE